MFVSVQTCLKLVACKDESLKSCRLVLYSSDDPRKKANAALLVSLYVVSIRITEMCDVLLSVG